MQKSQVRQFGMSRSIYSSKILGMSNNVMLHSPRSNSTQRQLHLRKSRITNIPDTRNINLASNIQFVVVFQTIEIQRMSEEIQTLRVRVKQYERRLFNVDNYEIQIKQLTEKCIHIQKERNDYREELWENKRASEMIFSQLEQMKGRYNQVDFTKMQKYKLQKMRNQQLMMQVQKWKGRYNALDESKAKELLAIKRMMQDQSRTYHSRQAKELFDRFQVQKQGLEQLIKSLKQSNISNQTQLKKVKFQLQKRQRQSQQLQRQVDDYEQKVALLSQESYRLQQMTKNKQQQMNELKQKVAQLEQSKKQLQTKIQQAKKYSQQRARKSQASIKQKQAQLNSLQKLSLRNKERLIQMDRVEFLLRQAQEQIQTKANMLQKKDSKILGLEQAINICQITQLKTRQQLSQLKTHIEQSSITIGQLLAKIQLLVLGQLKIRQRTYSSVCQMERSNKQYHQKMTQKTQQMLQNSSALFSQLKQSQRYINNLEGLNNQHKLQLIRLQKEKLEALNNIQEINRLQEQKYTLKKENQQLMSYVERLSKEKEDMVTQISRKEEDFMLQSKKKIKQVEQKYEGQIVMKLNQEVQVKLRQLQYFQKQTNNLNNTIKQISTKCKTLQKQLTNKENAIAIKQSHLNNALKQIQNLSQLIKSQSSLFCQLQHCYQQLNNQYENSFKEQIEALFSRVQTLRKTIKMLRHQVQVKLVKAQKANFQTVRLMQSKINQMIGVNLALMQKNNMLYQSLITNNNDNMSIDSNNTNINQTKLKNYKQQLTDTTRISTIFTSQAGIGNHNHNPKQNIIDPINLNQDSYNIFGTSNNLNNINRANKQPNYISILPEEFLLRHVIVCTQLQALRRRIGDKQAKVQKMKNSLKASSVSSNRSFVAIVNGNNIEGRLSALHRGRANGNEQEGILVGEIRQQDNNVYNNNSNNSHNNTLMEESTFMSNTMINRFNMNNPFAASVAGTLNQESYGAIHQNNYQNRFLTQTNEILVGSNINVNQLKTKRVTSEQRYHSPDVIPFLDSDFSVNKNPGIYTQRMAGSSSGDLRIMRNGFKSIGIRKIDKKNGNN